MTLPVAILAGGLATRLASITETIPKSLVKVAGRPFLFHQLDWLRDEGIKRVVLCLGYLGETIQDVVGDGNAFGVSVDYSFDGGCLLGTGGALRKAVQKLGEVFFVLYGDSYLSCSLVDVERAFHSVNQPALMTVLKNNGQWDQSNVLFGKGRLIRYDKYNPTSEMCHIDYGLSVLSKKILMQYESDKTFSLANVFMALSERGELAGLEVAGRFYEIGSPDGLKETEQFLAKRKKR